MLFVRGIMGTDIFPFLKRGVRYGCGVGMSPCSRKSDSDFGGGGGGRVSLRSTVLGGGVDLFETTSEGGVILAVGFRA